MEEFEIRRTVKYTKVYPISEYVTTPNLVVEFAISLSRVTVIPEELHFSDFKVEYVALSGTEYVKEIKSLATHVRVSIGWVE